MNHLPRYVLAAIAFIITAFAITFVALVVFFLTIYNYFSIRGHTNRPSVAEGFAGFALAVIIIIFSVLAISWLVSFGASSNGNGEAIKITQWTEFLATQIHYIKSAGSRVVICNLAIPSVIFFLSLGFLASLSWALLIYGKMRSVLWPEWGLNNDFSAVASRHGQLSQLWFSIAITVLLGAVIFAMFQVSLTTCKKIYNLDGEGYTIDYAVNALNGVGDSLEGAGENLKKVAHNFNGINDPKSNKKRLVRA